MDLRKLNAFSSSPSSLNVDYRLVSFIATILLKNILKDVFQVGALWRKDVPQFRWYKAFIHTFCVLKWEKTTTVLRTLQCL